MSEVQPTEVTEVIAEPIAEPIIEPVAEPLPEEKSYTYQPTDDAGRPMGGKQVFKYRTQEDLNKEFERQNVHLLRKLRAETRNNRLGISAPEEIAADAQKYEDPVDFSQHELTADQRVKLSRDFLDPEKFDEAGDTFFESKIGVKPEVLRQTLQNLQKDNANFKAVHEAGLFMEANPTFLRCSENGEAIARWLEKRGLAPVRSNYQKAYDTLKTAGVLIEAGEVAAIVQPEPVAVIPQPVVPEVPPIVEVAPHVPSRIPTGLTRNNSADAGIPRPSGDDIVYEFQHKDAEGKPIGEKRVFRGLAAVQAMPSDVFLKRSREPGFNKKVEKLEAEAAERRSQARQ